MGLGRACRALTNSLTQWLQGMQQGSIVMLAVIMGLMLAFDMGGPVNKVAYAFMLICVAQVFIPWYYCCRGDLCSAAGDGAGDADWS